MSRNPNYEEARVNLAFALAPENPSGAVQILAGLAKASSKPSVRFVDMACLCYSVEKNSEAWNALSHAKCLDPGDPRPHHWAGVFAWREGREREARVHALRCLRQVGGCVEGYETIGVCKDSKFDLSALVGTLSHACTNPRFRTIHVNVAHWLAAHDKREEAKEELKNIVRLDPSFEKYATARGKMELLWNHTRRAERWLRRAIECEPDASPAHEHLAKLYTASGDDLRAERHLVRASELNPNYPDLRYALARLCSRTERLEEAVSYLRSCLAIDPSFAMAHFHLGECYLTLGQLPAASQQFQRLPEEIRARPEVSAAVARCFAETADR